MKILIRNQKSEMWQMVQSIAYSNETELQKLLAGQPSLISLNEVREGAGPLVVAVREFPLDIGSVDLIGFTADGDIAIIECKLASNEEIKRKVIGQVLEYGANLWGMGYEDLEKKILDKSSRNLTDLVRVNLQNQEWDEESFRINVGQALQSGNFILIIVVDEINEELSRIVRFINEAGKPAFSLAALEMRRFQKDQTEILVPHLFGVVNTGKSSTTGLRKQWTEERFFEAVHNSLPQEIVSIIQDLYTWSRLKSKRVWFGTGTASGSFTFHYQKNGKSVSMFSIYTNGNLFINYGWATTQVTAVSLQRFHQAITKIPGFEGIQDDFNKWPNVRIKDVFLDKPDVLNQFKEVVEEFDTYFVLL